MKFLLGTLVVLATFVTLCNSQCYFIPNQSLKPNECQDLKGVSHPLNSVWKTKDCEECTCGQNAISCCNTAAIPTGYDTNKCQKILNKKTCTYTVVEKKDPGKDSNESQWPGGARTPPSPQARQRNGRGSNPAGSPLGGLG